MLLMQSEGNNDVMGQKLWSACGSEWTWTGMYVHFGVVMKKRQKSVNLLVSLLNSISVFCSLSIPCSFLVWVCVLCVMFSGTGFGVLVLQIQGSRII